MEQSGWDFLITGGVLVSLILWIFAKVSKRTIPELIRDIKDVFTGEGVDELTPEAMVWRD